MCILYICAELSSVESKRFAAVVRLFQVCTQRWLAFDILCYLRDKKSYYLYRDGKAIRGIVEKLQGDRPASHFASSGYLEYGICCLPYMYMEMCLVRRQFTFSVICMEKFSKICVF